jgi:hypothetical protein
MNNVKTEEEKKGIKENEDQFDHKTALYDGAFFG